MTAVIVTACEMGNMGEARSCVTRMQTSVNKAGELTSHAASLSLGAVKLRQSYLVAALKDPKRAVYAARRLGNNKVVTADRV